MADWNVFFYQGEKYNFIMDSGFGGHPTEIISVAKAVAINASKKNSVAAEKPWLRTSLNWRGDRRPP
jgi:hypothetical protein